MKNTIPGGRSTGINNYPAKRESKRSIATGRRACAPRPLSPPPRGPPVCRVICLRHYQLEQLLALSAPLLLSTGLLTSCWTSRSARSRMSRLRRRSRGSGRSRRPGKRAYSIPASARSGWVFLGLYAHVTLFLLQAFDSSRVIVSTPCGINYSARSNNRLSMDMDYCWVHLRQITQI